MDMFSEAGKRAQQGTDAQLQQQIENAYCAETHPTPSALLRDRLLLQAEATPQLAPRANTLAETSPNGANTTVSPAENAAVSRDIQPRNILARLFATSGTSGTASTSMQDKLRQLREMNWELYHEYLEQNLSCANSTSGVNF